MDLPKVPQKPSMAENSEEILLDIKGGDAEPRSKKHKKQAARKKGGLMDLYNELNQQVAELSPVSLKEKLIFFELFVATLNAGVPVAEALRMLETQSQNPKMQRVVRDMRHSIESGDSLAQALLNSDGVFDETTASIVAAGEKSGKLNDVMKELVRQYERMDSIQKKVKGVMTYPIIVVVVMILMVIVVMVAVVPKLVSVFEGAENLPLPTKILIAGSDFFRNQWGLFLLILGIVVGGVLLWKRSPAGKKQWSTFLLSIPIVGDFIQKAVLSRMTRIFSFLIYSGVPIIDGLRISAKVAGNPVYKRKILLAADDLTRGIEISENFSDDPKLFPPMLVKMISVGEKTASLGPVLEKIADFYDEDLERKIKMLSKLIEPFILLLMAGGAVFLILAIYLPILKMNDKVLG
ncbi:MAG: type II secretion system F family protein [Candidatus Gracilibacteria bacterium]|nr:type II secretion system F family protein [Candidatus Gracilibacteria bacterium]